MGVVLSFAALLFVFPTEVAIAGPLRSNGSPARLLGFLGLGLVVLGLLRARRRTEPTRVDPVVVLLVLYLAQSLFSYGVAAGRTLTAAQAASSLRSFLVVVAGCGIALAIAQTVRSVRQAQLVAGVLLGGCVLNAVVGILQSVGVSVSWASIVTLPGMALTSPPATLGTRLDQVRAVGTTSHAIEFAICLAVMIPLGIHLSRYATTPLARQLSLAATGVVLVATPFALSRAGIICIAVGVGVYLPFAGARQRVAVLLGAVVAAALAVVLAPTVVASFQQLFADVSVSGSEDASISGRLDDYPIVEQVFTSSPWLGGTTGVTGLILDNQWLSFVVSGGIVAAVSWAALLAVPVLANVHAAGAAPRSDARRSFAGALAAGITASAVGAFTLDTLSFQQATMLLFVFVGLTSSVVRDAREDSRAIRLQTLLESARTPADDRGRDTAGGAVRQ
jgi:O-antigen ligase